jgi:tetratricopeptide (TPR) repeat protein
MKKMVNKKNRKWMVLGIVLCVFVLVQHVSAQLKLPRVSPVMKMAGTIGVTKVSIKYSSPAVKGRQIWGKLVPYGLTKFAFGAGNPAPWRAGANENTIIHFSDDVKIEGHDLPAGSYGLHMIPSENDWVIIFSKNYSSWGSYFYDEKEDALRVTIKPKEAPFKEWLTYGLENFTKDSAVVFLHWEKLKVAFNVKVDSAALVLQSIKNQLRGTAGFTWQGWHQAANYLFRTKSNLDQAIEWVNKSVQINKNYTNRNTLGYILMAAGKKDEALKVFRENVKEFPNDWNVLDSLGENLVKTGNKKEGIKYYKKAHKMAPAQQKKRIEGILKKLQSK